MKSVLFLVGIAVLTATSFAQPTSKQPLPQARVAPAPATSGPTKPAQVGAATPNLPVATPPPAVPKPPPNVLFRPTYLTADIAHYTGLAFRLKHEASGQHYLVTSHSSFSKTAGLDVDMSSEDIARAVVGAVGVSCSDRTKLVLAQPYLPLKDARMTDVNGSEKNMAFFNITGPATEPALTLDPAPPIIGDRVWVYVKYSNTPMVGLEGATIAFVSEVEISYLLDNQGADLRNTSGAPILSLDGHVVAMHLGTFTSKTGRIFGYACPGSALRQFIEPVKRGKILQ